MKKVLITGAAGTVGRELIVNLLCEGKYSLTLLDLEIRKNKLFFKKYKNRTNIIYHDISNNLDLKNIVKDQDYIIHLAGLLPPITEIKSDLTNLINVEGSKYLINAIKKYNKEATLIFLSTTSIYGLNKKISCVKNKKLSNDNSYVEGKIKVENYITKNIKNYCILRSPIILSNIKNESIMCNILPNEVVNSITKEDVTRAIIGVLNNISKVNRKVINIGGNDTFNMSYKRLVNMMYKSYGFSLKYMLKNKSTPRNMSSPVCSDISKYNDILKYQEDNFEDYLNRLIKRNIFRRIRKNKK